MIWKEFSLTTLVSVPATYFKTYNLKFDGLFVVLFALILSAAAIRGRLRYHAGLLAVSLALGIVSYFMPTDAMGTEAIEVRLPAMMALALAASLRPDLEATVSVGRIAVGVALALVPTEVSRGCIGSPVDRNEVTSIAPMRPRRFRPARPPREIRANQADL